jgi:hypothetical protein
LLQTLLSFSQEAADPRPALVGPGGFPDHAAEMFIPGFRDATTRCWCSRIA